MPSSWKMAERGGSVSSESDLSLEFKVRILQSIHIVLYLLIVQF